MIKKTNRHKTFGKNLITISIFIVLVIFIGYGVYRRILKLSTSTNQEKIAVPVIVEKPIIRDMEKIYSFTGNLTPREMVNVTSKIPGRIEKILVKEGQFVKKGTILIKIEDRAAKLQVQQAYSAWIAAKAQYEKAIGGARKEQIENARALVKQAEEDLSVALENLKRAEKLYKSGAIPKAQFEDNESKYRAAKTQLENAKRNLKMMEEGAQREDIEMARANMEATKAQYDLAKLKLDYTKIKAPISGRIAIISVDEGNMVGQTTPILTIVQENPIQAEIAIPEKYYSEIQAKWKTTEVTIHPTALPENKIYSGKIVNVSSIIDPQTRTFIVKADIENDNLELLPGMFIEANLVIERRRNSITVPETAIVTRNGKKGIFIMENNGQNRARFVPVQTGLLENGRVEIVSITNDKYNNLLVIIDGNSFLEDGQIVKAVTQTNG